MTAAASPAPSNALATFLQLEALARGAQTLRELQFLIANETRRLIAFRQAFVLAAGPRPLSPYRVATASSVATIEPHAPLIQWIERMAVIARAKDPKEGPVVLTDADCPDDLRASWKEFALPFVMWCPLRLGEQQPVGALWLSREQAWQENERTLVHRLAEAYAHAWQALAGHRPVRRLPWLRRALVWSAVTAALAALAMPVRFSTLAPAKLVAKDPAIVSAPIDGVIAKILVPPNSHVETDQPILTFEDTTLRNQYEVAEKNLSVAVAEYRQASQGAFGDAQNKAKLPLLKAEAELREVERNYAFELLQQVQVTAPQAGVLLYGDESDWIGKPVVVGERIMDIADPTSIEVRIELPVEDAIVLKEGRPVQLFLDVDPLKTYQATLSHASYHAEVLPGNILAYRVTAELVEAAPDMRIGWQGTAKIQGDEVPLFYLVFRRPITAVRQYFGL